MLYRVHLTWVEFELTTSVVILWLGFRCFRPSVNTICGRIMIGLSLLSSVSKHNMWSHYNWVVVVDNTTTYCVYWRTTTTKTQLYYDNILCLLTEDKNDNPIIIRPHIVFTDGRLVSFITNDVYNELRSRVPWTSL
jgi:hypothetical protein